LLASSDNLEGEKAPSLAFARLHWAQTKLASQPLAANGLRRLVVQLLLIWTPPLPLWLAARSGRLTRKLALAKQTRAKVAPESCPTTKKWRSVGAKSGCLGWASGGKPARSGTNWRELARASLPSAAARSLSLRLAGCNKEIELSVNLFPIATATCNLSHKAAQARGYPKDTSLCSSAFPLACHCVCLCLWSS